MTFTIGVSNAYDAINKSIPTGGVKKPSCMFIKKITPVCTGCMPKDSAIGIMSGETINIRP